MECEEAASPSEEAARWKKLAEEYKRNYEDAAEELEEFQISSRELEAELEAQLEQAETKVRDLTSANQRLTLDYETCHEKLQKIQSDTHRQMNSLADDLAAVKKSKDELIGYIRELEHANDSLENSKRQTISTLEDFEQRLNQALERNAYLENELEEKDQLNATIQRLKDESRDLRLEMSLKTQRSPSAASSRDVSMRDESDVVGVAKESSAALASRSGTDSLLVPNGDHELRPHAGLIIGASSPLPSPSSGAAFPIAADGLTPTARITALNIVGDLLRKVGSLESKLASCRSASMGSATTTTVGSGVAFGIENARPRPNTIGDFSPNGGSVLPAGRPRANAVSAPMAASFENYV